jgi:hypothetical protein
MTPEDAWERWLEQRRAMVPPEGLTDRVMAAVQPAAMSSVVDSAQHPARQTWWPRLAPYLLASAASVVCLIRLYSLVSLILAPSSAFTDHADVLPKDNPHVELVASRP